MSNEKDFDFSLIVNDCESSDGQVRHLYFKSFEDPEDFEDVKDTDITLPLCYNYSLLPQPENKTENKAKNKTILCRPGSK